MCEQAADAIIRMHADQNREMTDLTNDYLLERKLREESPQLHQRVKDSVFVLQNMLERYLPRFPDYTDHSVLHSMDVLNYCNMLIGPEQVNRLSAPECYVLVMGCYLHDIGMGISAKDLTNFYDQLDHGGRPLPEDADGQNVLVRSFHHDLSGLFIRKYAGLFDFPSEDLAFAVIQISRGHRKTDLYDVNEYPDIAADGGPVRLPYLAAVLRLADEIDVASDRNPELLFDSQALADERGLVEFGKHMSVRQVEVRRDSIVLYTKPKSPEYIPMIEEIADKIRSTLDYCRKVAEARSEFRITQKEVVILPFSPETF